MTCLPSARCGEVFAKVLPSKWSQCWYGRLQRSVRDHDVKGLR